MKTKRINVLIINSMIALFFVTNGYSQDSYSKTPSDSEGPYYPVEKRSDEDNDLVNVKGKSKSATGDVLNLTGEVVDRNGRPQSDIVIEIWQTDSNGLYKHPRDSSSGKRDPFFQFWGRAKTDKEGRYIFKTLIPGKYEPRPSHIHFKIWKGDKVLLTSQMYIIKSQGERVYVNRHLKLEVTKTKQGQHSGFFRIVL